MIDNGQLIRRVCQPVCTLTWVWLYSLCFVLSPHFFLAVIFSLYALSGTDPENPLTPGQGQCDRAQEPLLFRKIQNMGTVAPSPMPPPHPPHPQISPLHITEQIILILLLILKYNHLLMILWTPWLPRWTAGLLGKCVRNCWTLCTESGHIHSSSWTWTMEWPWSGSLWC